ncbi:MAG: HAMP domain-containing histidine kinase, partial [Gemmatimonadetes bacterium]|nr:HAMP domain-containing histidine kinase [Gemmatimonadota bacterium]
LRLALRRGLAHVLISSALFAAYGAVFVIVWFFAHEQSATAITISSAGTILIVGLFIQPVLGRVQSFVDRVFFRERVDRLHAMVQLNADVRDITDFSLTAHRLVQGVRRAVQSDWVAIVLPDPSETVFVARADSRGTPPEVELPMDGAVASWLRRRQKALTATDVRTDPYLQAMSEGESAALKDLGAVLLVPLRDRTLLTGILAVGPKLVADDYSAADVEFLVAVADQTGLAIQHARMYADEHRRLAELENLGTLKSNLLQTVSHELKSPITAIKIATELLESAAAAGVSGDRRDRLIRTLKSGIDRLERLTQEALDYAAMQSAQLQLQPTDITLEDVVHEAASLLTPAMRARGQKFSVQTDPGVGLTHADAPRIERILSNLISNACKYTPENGEIRITISRDGDYHLVEVSDTGRGIPENDLELIFSPFYRSRNADGTSVGGSGLGLSIARFLAELHGGRLTVKSTVGLGSVFSLYLPAKGPPDRRGATAAEENGSAAPREPGRADASPKATTPREPVAPAGPRQSS